MGMGYQGYARFYVDANGGNEDEKKAVVVLTTGASVNLVLEPIYSSGVWGAGWYNAADSAHYADNAIRYEGNIETELQVGENGAYWNLIQDFAIAHRAYPKSLEISPDGAHVYKYLIKNSTTINSPDSYLRDTNNNYTHGAYCTSLNFSTSAGSMVTSSVGVIAIYREEEAPDGTKNYDDFSYINQYRGVVAGNIDEVKRLAPLNPGATNVNPIPYWKTDARLFCTRPHNATEADSYTGQVGPETIQQLFNVANCNLDPTDPEHNYLPQEGMETVEWNVDLNNNQQILYTCCGSRLPRAILMGPMAVSGAVTLYHNSGIFDPVTGPDGNHPYTIEKPFMTAEHTWFNASIEVDNGRKVNICVPAVVVESDDYSIQSADSVTNRAFNIKGLGGRCLDDATLGKFVLPPCLMSRYVDIADADIDDTNAGQLIAVPWTYSGGDYTYSQAGYEAAEGAEDSSASE